MSIQEKVQCLSLAVQVYQIDRTKDVLTLAKEFESYCAKP